MGYQPIIPPTAHVPSTMVRPMPSPRNGLVGALSSGTAFGPTAQPGNQIAVLDFSAMVQQTQPQLSRVRRLSLQAMASKIA